MRFRKSFPVLLLCLSFLCSYGLLKAGPSETVPKGPKGLIDRMHHEMAEIMSAATPSSMKAVRDSVKSKFAGLFDLETFARLAFKRYYNDLSKADRKAYLTSLRGLVEATYMKRLKPGTTYWMKHRGEQVIGQKAKVSITVGSKDTEFDVDYLLHQGTDDSWLIYDIWIDDVSLMRTYRSQFYKIYKEHGLHGENGLIGNMDRRQREQ